MSRAEQSDTAVFDIYRVRPSPVTADTVVVYVFIIIHLTRVQRNDVYHVTLSRAAYGAVLLIRVVDLSLYAHAGSCHRYNL